MRKEVLRRREALTEGERAVLSRRVFSAALDLPAYRRAGAVLAYASFGTEPRTDGFMGHVLDDDKVLVLPRVEPDGLRLYEVRNVKLDLVPGTWGIREPAPDRCPVMDLGGVDFALIPGVAFDRGGGRLGYGGGFYDRLLAGGLPDATPLVSGAFGVQMVNEVPADPHDVPMDAVVTEREIYLRKGGRNVS